MKHIFPAVLVAFLTGIGLTAHGQQDSAAFDPKFGAGLNYTGVSLIESAVIELQFHYTMRHHAVALGPHIAYHDLFPGQSEWQRQGVSFTYAYFPLRTDRLFSPFLFYDLNYAYSRSTRQVNVSTDDGSIVYSAMRTVTMNGLSHHFGIGTRCSVYNGLFIHLSLGAGPASFGESVHLRPLDSQWPESRQKSHPFATYQTVYTFRFGLAYQIGISKLRKGNPDRCCN